MVFFASLTLFSEILSLKRSLVEGLQLYQKEREEEKKEKQNKSP